MLHAIVVKSAVEKLRAFRNLLRAMAMVQDPVARKFVLLVDFQGVGLGSAPLTFRDLMVVMQEHSCSVPTVTSFLERY